MSIKQITDELSTLVQHKNSIYGDSAGKSAQFLKLLYPDGVPVESYADVLLLVRIFDKQMRIATSPNALAENPYSDIAGYAIMALVENAVMVENAKVEYISTADKEVNHAETADEPRFNSSADLIDSFFSDEPATKGANHEV